VKESVRKKYFANLSRENGSPLFAQLRVSLQRFIADYNIGALLPSERELVEATQLSRGTIRRAFALLEKDALIKRSVKGSIIITKDKPGNQMLLKSLPSVNDFGFRLNTRKKNTLKILLYENLPYQLNFWHYVFKDFKIHNPNVNIEPEWKMMDNMQLDDYMNNRANSKFDIIQLPSAVLLPGTLPSLRENSAEMRQFMNRKCYYLNSYCSQTQELLKYSVPICFSIRMLSWNKIWADKLNLDFFKLIKAQNIETFFSNAMDKLPESLFLTGHHVDASIGLGYPDSNNPIAVADYIRKIVNLFKMLTQKNRSPFMFSATDHYTSRRSLLQLIDGEILLSSGLNTAVLIASELQNNSKFGRLVPASYANCKQYTSSVGFGVTKHSKNSEVADQFRRFLLTNKIQYRLAREMKMAPMLISAVEELSSYIPQKTEELKKIFHSYSGQPYDSPEFNLFETIGKHVNDIIHKKNDTNSMVSIIVNDFNATKNIKCNI
jgi:spermidine/putrescine-binding protein